MAKELRCGDLMPGCNRVIAGKDEKEVIEKTTQHARKEHNITTMTPDFERRVQNAIHDKR